MAKAGILERILALLDAERVELRCAAAMVLGAAGKGQAEIGRALAKKLEDPSPMMRRFVLDALEEMGAKGLSSALVPLLASSDEEVKKKALRLLAAQGAHGAAAGARRPPATAPHRAPIRRCGRAEVCAGESSGGGLAAHTVAW